MLELWRGIPCPLHFSRATEQGSLATTLALCCRPPAQRGPLEGRTLRGLPIYPEEAEEEEEETARDGKAQARRVRSASVFLMCWLSDSALRKTRLSSSCSESSAGLLNVQRIFPLLVHCRRSSFSPGSSDCVTQEEGLRSARSVERTRRGAAAERAL
jgi:hypothetical protein